MDEHKTPEEMNTEETVQPEAAVEETVTDTPSATEACAQPEEAAAGETAAAETDTAEAPAGEADAAEVPAPAEKKPMSVRARHALRRGVAGLLAAIVLLAVSGFGVFRIARGAQEISGTFDADPGTFVQHDIVFILNTFSDPNGGSAQYGVVPIGGKLVAFRFPARWNASVKTMPEAVSSALYDWYTENHAYLQQIGAIGDSDDAADYLPDAIVRVDYVGGIPQGWVEGLTVAAAACLIYAIVVLIRILCGKYDEVKLPDITFELVDMTPETPAEPEAEPEETPEAPAEPETPEAPAEPEKSDETEDTPDA